MTTDLMERTQWFREAQFGLFLHFGPYAEYGRGEQVLFRERLDPRQYEEASCRWNPERFDAAEIARVALASGMKYAVLTTRHHDGYCLWDTQTTDYSAARQAPKRDLVREYVEALRAAGLRVGLYYSLADWRIPAYWEGESGDPRAFDKFIDYVHAQVRELLTNYGKIDILWFDGAWPHDARGWRSHELVDQIRALQPDILINNRLGASDPNDSAPGDEAAGALEDLGDFGTPEHHITAESGRVWESCQVTTWRLWGWTAGERLRPADLLLDMLCEAASKGGNLLLNVGPRPDGSLDPDCVERLARIGDWLRVHGEAIYGSQKGEITEFVTWGWQTVRENNLYLICRFWHPGGALRLAGLASKVNQATLVTTGQPLDFGQAGDIVTLTGLPHKAPTELFPVIKLTCESQPTGSEYARQRLWTANPPGFYAQWARLRGEGFDTAKLM